MLGQLFRKFGPLMCIVAGIVLIAIEWTHFRKYHDVSIFWLAIAITMIVVALYELITKRNDDHSPLQ
jgi:hypothetical protein